MTASADAMLRDARAWRASTRARTKLDAPAAHARAGAGAADRRAACTAGPLPPSTREPGRCERSADARPRGPRPGAHAAVLRVPEEHRAAEPDREHVAGAPVHQVHVEVVRQLGRVQDLRPPTAPRRAACMGPAGGRAARAREATAGAPCTACARRGAPSARAPGSRRPATAAGRAGCARPPQAAAART